MPPQSEPPDESAFFIITDLILSTVVATFVGIGAYTLTSNSIAALFFGFATGFTLLFVIAFLAAIATSVEKIEWRQRNS